MAHPDPNDKDYIILSTGKRVYAHQGIVGLSEPGEDGWVIHEGYDGDMYYPWQEEPYVTKDELVELADMMIERWQRFRSSL